MIGILLPLFSISIFSNNCFADDILSLDVALSQTRIACSGISNELAPLKRMAGINTAITGVGTGLGIGAAATGFAKQSKDKEVEKWEAILEEMERKQSEQDPELTHIPDEEANSIINAYKSVSVEGIEIKLDKATQESRNLGNWRTGLMAGGAATNVAGAVIAGGNKVDTDLNTMIKNCKASINKLNRSIMQARMDGADISKAQIIVSACSGYDTLNLSSINNRASGAQWSSIVGASTGVVGTITSAVANTDKTRAGDSAKEKNLNTTSNVLAIGTTAASATATIFNASQISAIKRASDIADKCEGAL